MGHQRFEKDGAQKEPSLRDPAPVAKDAKAAPERKKDRQAERGQAVQAVQRHGESEAGRGDWPAHRCFGGAGQDSALCRRRSLFPAFGERARRGCVCGSADLLPGRPAPGGAADHDRRAEEGVGGQDHGGCSLLRICAPGSERPPARGDQRQTYCRPADDGWSEPRACLWTCTRRRFRGSSTFRWITCLPARCW
jgi:hypothetical protein